MDLLQNGAHKLELRPYQQECIAAIKSNYASGKNRLIINLATGGGKTVIFSNLIKILGKRTLILVPSIELLEQAYEKIKMVAPELNVGRVNADFKEFDADVVISTIQAAMVPGNLEKLKDRDFDLLVFDESHKSAANRTREVLHELGFGKNIKPSKLLTGWTATPYRAGNLGLGEIFDNVAFDKSLKDLIQDGYLVPLKAHQIINNLDLKAVETADGDYVASSLNKVMHTPVMHKLVLESYLKYANRLQSICFCTSIEHAIALCELFQKNGIESRVIFGDMDKKVRGQYIADYKSGKVTVLFNFNVLVAGFDHPATGAVIVCRVTKNVGLFTQMIGRATRPYPNKTHAVILDFHDKAHTLISCAVLLGDAELSITEKKRRKEREAALPPQLSPKLKTAILDYNPLGTDFIWSRQFNGSWILKGNVGNLTVKANVIDKYIVTYCHNNAETEYVIAQVIDFEYAFAAAEDFARLYREHFSLSDKAARWRNEPASEAQLEILRRKGFTKDIELLTKGEIDIVFKSGVLNRNSGKRFNRYR